MKLKITLITFIVFPLFIYAQKSESHLSKKLSDWKIKPIGAMQVWSTYTVGAEVFNPDSVRYEAVDDRLNFQLHRSRLGIKAEPYTGVKFNVTTAFDFVGQDILGGTEQPGNNGASPRLRLWSATVHWQLKPGNEKVNLTAGYFIPQIGRESITAALRSTSFEKAWSQNYLRRHLVGKGPGRTGGINIGGLFEVSDKFGFSYDAGLYNPTFYAYGGNSVGKKYSPLLVGRMVGYFGDPEMESYGLGHKVNYFGKRNGLSFALSAAQQNETDLFLKNTALGADFLLNWQNLNLDGDWTFLWREVDNGNGQTSTLSAATGYIRLSLNVNLKKGFVLEPTVMHVQFNGETEASEQVSALTFGMPSGEERITNFGFNLYPNPNLKFSLFYTLRSADSGEVDDALGVNNYFIQNGVGPVRRGDFVGLGLVMIL